MCKERCLFTWTGMTVKLQLPFCFSHYIPKPRLWFRTFTLLCLLVKCIKLKIKKKITFKIHFFLGIILRFLKKKRKNDSEQSEPGNTLCCAIVDMYKHFINTLVLQAGPCVSVSRKEPFRITAKWIFFQTHFRWSGKGLYSAPHTWAIHSLQT